MKFALKGRQSSQKNKLRLNTFCLHWQVFVLSFDEFVSCVVAHLHRTSLDLSVFRCLRWKTRQRSWRTSAAFLQPIRSDVWQCQGIILFQKSIIYEAEAGLGRSVSFLMCGLSRTEGWLSSVEAKPHSPETNRPMPRSHLHPCFYPASLTYIEDLHLIGPCVHWELNPWPAAGATGMCSAKINTKQHWRI